ncbi:MAG TPA: N-acetylmuramoyl-L-alanine amidase [Ohtaekwangia sp.]|nr:N-acetylmuramoyl-L-alanine amidase [Ohtaekwangia sp.]
MKLKFLVIHCTATPEFMKVTPADIRFWHTADPPKGRGWRQVGYSDMIMLDGSIINLVPYDRDDNVDKWEITNGVAGINSQSRHVVYVGGCDGLMKPKDTRTPAQLKTMKEYVLRTIAEHPDILVSGHRQFANKDCPSFNVPLWLDFIGVDHKNIYLPPSVL